MATKNGKTAKVTLGTYKVAEIGTWTMSGLTNEVLEDTEFGDTVKTFDFSLQDGGELSFSGHYDPTDTTGQTLLDSAVKNQSKVTNLRLYIDNTSYYTVDVTGISGSALLPIKARAINMDKAALGRIDFTCKVSGRMELV